MNLPHYTYFNSNDYLDYQFYSEGPKGKIKKVVRFSKIKAFKNVYNLGFGDETEGAVGFDDLINTNNGDRDLVLSTVANTVIDFSNQYSHCHIYAKGSTASRTRLYQIGIAGLFDEISLYFDVLGLIGDDWYDFEKGINYGAFLIKRK